MKTLKIATRGSPLALWQARWVRDALLGTRGTEEAKGGLSFEIVTVKTLAEKFPERAVQEIGMGIFTREIDEALLRAHADVAVHSLKDVPSEMHADLALAAVPERENPLDAFISADGRRFEELPPGAKVGTGSPRRKAQILCRRPDIEVVPLRGNVATRVQKMAELGLHGIILAHAGLRRLGEEGRITQILTPDIILPAVSQGAIGVVARRSDREIQELLGVLDHSASHVRVVAERGFLRRLRGGCQVPAAALAEIHRWEDVNPGGKADPIGGSGSRHVLQHPLLRIQGLVAAPDGSALVRGEVSGSPEEAEALGVKLAEEILERGGATILLDAKR